MPLAILSIKEWLKRERHINALHLELMAHQYDLSGSRESHQFGLSWWVQQNILLTAVGVRLLESGIAIPESGDRLERAFAILDALGKINPEVCERAWTLWERPMPPADTLLDEVDRTLEFVQTDLALQWAARRTSALKRWASNTHLLRTVASRFGLAQSNDWYLKESAAPELDWYDEIMNVIDRSSRT